MRESVAADVFCAKAKRQQKGFICAKAKRQRQQHEGRHDVGHFGNATGRGVLRPSSYISAGVQTPAERS
ncbi:hypothetical protein [Lysinibacillus sp. NPDC056232]|uniref:hypothetical protein n=1 Tax=Lysinibacillus sp. NPDC056232 TaxID=3345756 RepID=UPI0035E0344C